MTTQEWGQGANCVAWRPCFNLIKNSLTFWRVPAHYLSNWKTFSVRLKCGMNDVLEFILAFCLRDIFWKRKEYILDLKKSLVNNAEDSENLVNNAENSESVFSVVCFVAISYRMGPNKVTDKDWRYDFVIDTWSHSCKKIPIIIYFCYISYISYVKALHNIFCIAGGRWREDGT